jgi:hypothetical protein
MLNQMFVGTSIPEDKKHIVIEESPVTKPICGICALEISNTIHGDTRTSFTGPGAESCRVRAIAWRRMHPEIGPTNGENKAVSH